MMHGSDCVTKETTGSSCWRWRKWRCWGPLYVWPGLIGLESRSSEGQPKLDLLGTELERVDFDHLDTAWGKMSSISEEERWLMRMELPDGSKRKTSAKIKRRNEGSWCDDKSTTRNQSAAPLNKLSNGIILNINSLHWFFWCRIVVPCEEPFFEPRHWFLSLKNGTA